MQCFKYIVKRLLSLICCDNFNRKKEKISLEKDENSMVLKAHSAKFVNNLALVYIHILAGLDFRSIRYFPHF